MGGLHFFYPFFCPWTGASQVALVVKNPPANAGDIRDESSIPRSRRSPGGGHSNPLQCSCLENPMDREAWRSTAHGVAKSWTRLKQLSSTHTVNGHLGLRVYKYLSESLFSILSGVCPEMELLDHLIILHLIFFEEFSYWCPQQLPILHSHQQWRHKGSSFSTSSLTYYFLSLLFGSNHPHGCEVLGFISFFFLICIYLFGHIGSSLWCLESFNVVSKLCSSCGAEDQ